MIFDFAADIVVLLILDYLGNGNEFGVADVKQDFNCGSRLGKFFEPRWVQAHSSCAWRMVESRAGPKWVAPLAWIGSVPSAFAAAHASGAWSLNRRSFLNQTTQFTNAVYATCQAPRRGCVF